MSSQSPKYEYPRSIVIDTYVQAMNLLPCAGLDKRRNRVAIASQAEETARDMGHTTYEAFEAEFLRLVEIAAARLLIEEGL